MNSKFIKNGTYGLLKLGNVPMDANLYHMSTVKDFVDFVNEKMILDINFEVNVQRLDIEIDLWHMHDGKVKRHFVIRGLNAHNTMVLIENIHDYLKQEDI